MFSKTPAESPSFYMFYQNKWNCVTSIRTIPQYKTLLYYESLSFPVFFSKPKMTTRYSIFMKNIMRYNNISNLTYLLKRLFNAKNRLFIQYSLETSNI